MPIRELNRYLRQHWRNFLLLHLMFSLLGVALFTPLFSSLLQGLLTLSGNPAVADQDIARLLLSPAGLIGGIALVSILLAIFALEQGALQLTATGALQGSSVRPITAASWSLRHGPALLRLTLALTLRLLLYLLPLLAWIGGVALLLLGDYDINYYLSQRPPAFYQALAAALPALLLWLLLVGRQLLRWSLALPLALFEDYSGSAALAESARLTRGRVAQVLRRFAGWLLTALVLAVIPALFLDLTTGWLVADQHQSLSRLIPLFGATALCWLLLNTLATALIVAGANLVIAGLYRELGPQPDETALQQELGVAGRGPLARLSAGQLAALLLVFVGAAAGTGLYLLQGIQTDDTVLVVAHRGAAGAAPENTLAAVQRALDDGADWVEIDVQETRDGEVVVVHDSDFMKLAGDPLKIWDGDLAQVRALDVGSWFDPQFGDQRVPLLSEVLEAVRGRAQLVIELKYYGHDEQLEQRVVDIVEAAGMADQVAIMSLKLAGVQKLQALRPAWHTGLLAATALGDLSRVEVDFLAVNANMASGPFIRRAHQAGRRVFVWTVNDALSLSRWASAGVDGIITDEPALARRILQEREQLSSSQRLLLSAALFFGRPEALKQYRDDSP